MKGANGSKRANMSGFSFPSVSFSFVVTILFFLTAPILSNSTPTPIPTSTPTPTTTPTSTPTPTTTPPTPSPTPQPSPDPHKDFYVTESDCSPYSGTGTQEDPFCGVQTAFDNFYLSAFNIRLFLVGDFTTAGYLDIYDDLTSLEITSFDEQNPTTFRCSESYGFGFSINGDIDVKINNVRFDGCLGPIELSGVFSAIISNVHISNCISGDGYSSGIYVYTYYDNADLSISNCLFVNNTSDNDGSDVRIETYVGEKKKHSVKDDLKLADRRSNRLMAKDYYSQKLSITDSQFHDSYSSSYGGAVYIYVSDIADVTISKCDFKNNYADYGGGALYIDSGGNAMVTITKSNFRGNYAGDDGGAVLFTGYCDVEISNSTFVENEGYNGGGVAFSVEDGSLVLQYSLFKNNNAIYNGGGLFTTYTFDTFPETRARSDNAIKFVAENVGWSRNTAESGGGVYLDVIDAAFRSCYFEKNNATQEGGGMYSNLNNAEFVVIESCSFIGNIAPGSYGLNFGSESLGKRSFQSVVHIRDSEIMFGSSGTGGIFFNNVGGVIASSRIWGNSRKGISCLGSTIDASKATSIFDNSIDPYEYDEEDANIECDYSKVILSNGNDGCSCNDKLDICGVCNGNSSCLVEGCKVPFFDCQNRVQQSFLFERFGVGLFYELSSGKASVKLTPDESSSESVSARLISLREVSPSGDVITTYDLEDGSFIPGVPLRSIDENGNPMFTISFLKPVGSAFFAVKHTLYSEDIIITESGVTFLVRKNFLKFAFELNHWTSENDIKLDIQLDSQKKIVSQGIPNSNSSNSNNPNVREIVLNTPGGQIPLTFIDQFTANNTDFETVIIDTNKINQNSFAVTFSFKGPLYSFLYDPDMSMLVSTNSDDDDGDDTETLLIAILVPILCVGALCVCVIAIVVGSTVIYFKRKALRKKIGNYSETFADL